jgi:hypothetical protein
MPSRFRSAGLRPALQLESLFQRVFRSAASRWYALRRFGRVPDLETLGGRRCHCDPQNPMHYVHSEGLRESCDLVIDFGSNVVNRGRGVWPVASVRHAAANLKRGAAVYVKTDRLAEFTEWVLPSIREPFVLVTGDSDMSPVLGHSALLEDARVSHWFVQNCDFPGRHPKLTRIPIGIDNPIFTKLEKRIGFALTMVLGRTPFDLTVSRNDMGDQAQLRRIGLALSPTSARPPRVLCTFHQIQKIVRSDLRHLPARALAHRELADNPCCYFPGERLPQDACWRIHDDFAFEASPHGNGLDCFRTWEALALGTIPIVKRSTLDPLFEDAKFPVVVVDAWDEITERNLVLWQSRLGGCFGPGLDARLSVGYWADLIARTGSEARGRQNR